MKPIVSLRRALTDPNLLGSARIMGGDSRKPLRTLLIAMLGESLIDKEEHTIHERFTGRAYTGPSRAKEFHAFLGRRSGKSSGLASLVLYLSALCDYSDCLSPGEKGVALVIAATIKQAETLFGYIVGQLHDIPALAKLITGQTAHSISFGNIEVQVRAADCRNLRGLTLIAVIADEICKWRKEGSVNSDEEVIFAVLPGLLTTQGPLITLGSPYEPDGFAYDTYVAHHGPNGDPKIMVAHGASREFNATIPQEDIDRAFKRNENFARREYMAEFLEDDEGGVFSFEVIDNAITSGRVELPSIAGVSYVAFVDSAGGSGQDEMVLAIAHAEGETAVLDALRVVKPPFSPDTVIASFAATMKDYGVNVVVGDNYGAKWPPARFAAHGVRYELLTKSASDIYQSALPLFTAGRVALLDNSKLRAQLAGLKLKTSETGKSRICHKTNAHDDLANAACGALVIAGEGFGAVLSHYADCLVDNAPVEIPHACRAVFATLAVDKEEGRRAFVYFALTKSSPQRLVILDFETGRGDIGIYAAADALLQSFSEACHAENRGIFASKEQVLEAFRYGSSAIALDDLANRDNLGSVAASYANRGLVKVGMGAHAKSQVEPLPAALSFRYATPTEPLDLAVVLGVVAGLDTPHDPSASAQ